MCVWRKSNGEPIRIGHSSRARAPTGGRDEPATCTLRCFIRRLSASKVSSVRSWPARSQPVAVRPPIQNGAVKPTVGHWKNTVGGYTMPPLAQRSVAGEDEEEGEHQRCPKR